MMIYLIPKDDDKPIKIVFEGGKGSNPIVEDDRVYFIDEHPSPEEVGKAFRTLYERLMSIEEVFEKQIPKKPIFESEQTSPFGVDDVPYCPSCRCDLPEVSYCEKCGQALDWSDTE